MTFFFLATSERPTIGKSHRLPAGTRNKQHAHAHARTIAYDKYQAGLNSASRQLTSGRFRASQVDQPRRRWNAQILFTADRRRLPRLRRRILDATVSTRHHMSHSSTGARDAVSHMRKPRENTCNITASKFHNGNGSNGGSDDP